MKFKNLFRWKTKKKASALSQIWNGKHDEWDHPNFVYLASKILSKYGVILEQTSKLFLGVCEKRLPYHKREIETAIELMLKFLNNKESWIKFKNKYPEIARTIFTDKYYNALVAGYLDLAKFVPENEGELCERASKLFEEKNAEKVTDEIKSSWFEEAIQISQRIRQESSSRLQILHNKFGKEDYPF
jgi:hypothetical protein